MIESRRHVGVNTSAKSFKKYTPSSLMTGYDDDDINNDIERQAEYISPPQDTEITDLIDARDEAYELHDADRTKQLDNDLWRAAARGFRDVLNNRADLLLHSDDAGQIPDELYQPEGDDPRVTYSKFGEYSPDWYQYPWYPKHQDQHVPNKMTLETDRPLTETRDGDSIYDPTKKSASDPLLEAIHQMRYGESFRKKEFPSSVTGDDSGDINNEIEDWYTQNAMGPRGWHDDMTNQITELVESLDPNTELYKDLKAALSRNSSEVLPEEKDLERVTDGTSADEAGNLPDQLYEGDATPERATGMVYNANR